MSNYRNCAKLIYLSTVVISNAKVFEENETMCTVGIIFNTVKKRFTARNEHSNPVIINLASVSITYGDYIIMAVKKLALKCLV